MSSLTRAFGLTVRSHRKERALSQEALAERAGVHRTYVGMIERGEKNLTLENIYRIASALGVAASDLLKATEEQL